jgi:hypothetical protein
MERYRAHGLGQGPPFGDGIDGINDMRAHHEGRLDGHQSDRPKSDHAHAAAGADIGVARAEPGGRHRIGHHQCLVFADAVGDFDRVHVGGGHAEGFGLHALQPRRKTVTAAGVVLAIIDHARQAGTAGTAADGGRHHHLVANFDPRDSAADLDHFAHGFMADAKAGIFGKAMAVIDMKVAAADRAGGHLDDGIAIGFELWILHAVMPDVAFAEIAQGLHASPSKR